MRETDPRIGSLSFWSVCWSSTEPQQRGGGCHPGPGDTLAVPSARHRGRGGGIGAEGESGGRGRSPGANTSPSPLLRGPAGTGRCGYCSAAANALYDMNIYN